MSISIPDASRMDHAQFPIVNMADTCWTREGVRVKRIRWSQSTAGTGTEGEYYSVDAQSIKPGVDSYVKLVIITSRSEDRNRVQRGS